MFSTGFSSNDLLFLLNGAWVTLQLTFWSIMLGSLAGLLFGLLRALLPVSYTHLTLPTSDLV